MLLTHVLPTIFIYIPESILTITITCALLGIKEEWRKLIPMGVLLGIEMYSVGYLSGSYILVMLVHYVFVVGGLRILNVEGFYQIAICTSITFSIVLMLEYLCLSFLAFAVDIHPQILMENPVLRIEVFAVQICLALSINIVLKKSRLSIFGD